jgi:Acyl-CoA carboxylase epsilon subunit
MRVTSGTPSEEELAAVLAALRAATGAGQGAAGRAGTPPPRAWAGAFDTGSSAGTFGGWRHRRLAALGLTPR